MKTYTGKNVTGALVSEKYDGIQAVWTGRRLETKTGNRIHAPEFWLEGLPARPLKGELWLGRDMFDETLSIVTRKAPDERWRKIRYMVFQGYAETKYAKPVRRFRVNSKRFLNRFYSAVLKRNGEGIIIEFPDGTIEKHKPVKDDDGIVVAVETGTGNFAGLLVRLVVKLRNGNILNIGSGFNNRVREFPPLVGQIVKFEYRGFTSKGLPRHASYIGIRAERYLKWG